MMNALTEPPSCLQLSPAEEERYTGIANGVIDSVLSAADRAENDEADWKTLGHTNKISIREQRIGKKEAFRVQASTHVPASVEEIITPLIVLGGSIAYRHFMRQLYGKLFVDGSILYQSPRLQNVNENFSIRLAALRHHIQLCFLDYSKVLTLESREPHAPCFIRIFESVYVPDILQDNTTKRLCAIRQCGFVVRNNSVLEFTCIMNMDNMGAVMRRHCRHLLRDMGRALVNFMNLILSSQLSPQLELAERWVPDALRVACTVCTRRFTPLRRRHHCRACGEIACGRCCRFYKVVVPIVGIKPVRICVVCLLNRSLSDPTPALMDYIQNGTCSTIVLPSPTTHVQTDLGSLLDLPLDQVSLPTENDPGCFTLSSWTFQQHVLEQEAGSFNRLCASVRTALDVPVALIALDLPKTTSMLLFGLGKPFCLPRHVITDINSEFCMKYDFCFEACQKIRDGSQYIGFVTAAANFPKTISRHETLLLHTASRIVPLIVQAAANRSRSRRRRRTAADAKAERLVDVKKRDALVRQSQTVRQCLRVFLYTQSCNTFVAAC